MSDVNCFLAGMTRLIVPFVLLVLWHRKTGARIFPALAAFLVCFPVFMTGSAIRSGFSHDDFFAYYISQGVLFGVLEEGAKYLMMRYALTSYENRRNAVSYGIGHSAYEEFGSAIKCFALIGTNKASPDIFWYAVLSLAEGTAFSVSLTILIYYGISTDNVKIYLPLAILLHAAGNASQGILIESAAITINTILTAGQCIAAYSCYRKMHYAYEDDT